MREKLNNNPMVQVAIVAVLLLGTGFFVMSSMGGGGGSEEAASESSTSEVAGTTEEAAISVTTATEEAATGAAAAPEPGALAAVVGPPPRPVTAAFESGDIVVLLFVKDGGIDDRLVTRSVDRLKGLSHVATFIVPAHEIARYTTISQGVEVNRTPALVVVRPKHLTGDVPSASVQYGFQSPASVEQAVIDAGYKGPTVDYHP
jgi:hypothetical protein